MTLVIIRATGSSNKMDSFRRIPTGGLLIPVNEPESVISAHGEKVQLVKFHPTAKDVLLTAAFDRSVKIWNLNDPENPKMLFLVRFQFIARQMLWLQWVKR